MPAIYPARLRKQTAQLGESFLNPDLYMRQLHDLLDYYADRTRRPGIAGPRPSRLPHYSVPQPVIRQILTEADRCAAETGGAAALALADRLWADGYFETRLIAIHLLGGAAPDGIPADQVAARVISWSRPDEDPTILKALLDSAKSVMQRTGPTAWFDLVRTWTASHDATIQEMGLHALRSLLDEPQFENLPAVFSTVASVLHTAPAALVYELAGVLEACARHSPGETLYFIRQTVAASPEPHITRLIRRCLPFFDEEGQKKLRQSLVARTRTG